MAINSKNDGRWARRDDLPLLTTDARGEVVWLVMDKPNDDGLLAICVYPGTSDKGSRWARGMFGTSHPVAGVMVGDIQFDGEVILSNVPRTK